MHLKAVPNKPLQQTGPPLRSFESLRQPSGPAAELHRYAAECCLCGQQDNMDSTIIYLTAFVALSAAGVATAILIVRRDGRGMGDLIKQLIIWVAITALLPLTSWAGATMLHPRTKLKELMAQSQRVESAMRSIDYKDEEARQKNWEEQERLRKPIEEEQRLYYRAMFWISYPIGLIALVVGLNMRPLPVGTALAFGGLCTLATGCYSYWDDMGDALRFFSLLIALGIITAIGLLRFGRAAAA